MSSNGNSNVAECDSCAEANLKCDGRSPCSWCLKRNLVASAAGGNGANQNGSSAGGSEAGLPPFLHHLGSSPVSCTYSGYSEPFQRHGLHSPQPSLHIGTRDRSPYTVLRISSPPPPSSSHSTASGGGGGGTTTSKEAAELLTRISTSETQLTSLIRGQGHGFTHQQTHSQSLHHPAHSHSLSHSSTHSISNSPFSGGNAIGNTGSNIASSTVGNISSTLTPITPSHPSSLHHYMVSGGSGRGETHSFSHHHQRSSSRHSPPQQHLSPSHDPGYYHNHSHAESRERDSPHQHRPRQLSTSSTVQLPRPQTSGSTSGRGSFSKVPTPPESSVGTGTNGNGPSNSTKLPEISNILTLLSPAPGSASADSKQSPHPFPTPVSGVGSATHGILNMGLGSSSIQHLQSDVRGSSSNGPETINTKMGMGERSGMRTGSISGLHSLEGSRRSSTEQIGGSGGVSRELPSPALSASPPSGRVEGRKEGKRSRSGSQSPLADENVTLLDEEEEREFKSRRCGRGR
ncbi:hypothetical protein FRC14_005368 [Serendipita sp. 396]|nr:hypothetical protein FRC14_005368 [Serendipita sp. 396]